MKRLVAGIVAVCVLGMSVITPAMATTYQWSTTALGTMVATTVSNVGSRAAVTMGASGLGRMAAWAANPALGLAVTIGGFWLMGQQSDGTDGYAFAPSAGPGPLPLGSQSTPATLTQTYPGVTVYRAANPWGYGCGADNQTRPTKEAAAQCAMEYWDSLSAAASCGQPVFSGNSWGYDWKSSPAGSCIFTGYSGWVTPVVTCPNGGTLSGGQCVDANWYSCPDDSWTLVGGVCTKGGYAPTAGPVYTAAPDGSGWIPDPSSPAATAPTTQAPPSPAIINGPDPMGNPTSTVVTPQPGGGINVQNWTQSTVNNQTYTTHNTITINNAGAVTQSTTQTTIGTIDQAKAGTGTTAQQGVPAPIDIPTDYAREQTLQGTNQRLDQLHEDVSPTQAAPDASLSTQTQSFEAAASAHEDVIDGIGAKGQGDEGMLSWDWLPELPSGSCTGITYGVPGHTYSWDWCPVIARISAIAGYALYIATGWVIFTTLTAGRREG